MSGEIGRNCGLDKITPVSFEATQVAETARAAMRDARAIADIACQAYRLTLPPDRRASARTDRVPVIVTGPPAAALETAVAMSATCTAAASLALELSLVFEEPSATTAIAAAVAATSGATRVGVRALRMPRAGELRVHFAHATAKATHQLADALNSPRRDHGLATMHSKFTAGRFPKRWRDSLVALSNGLTRLASDEHRANERVGAAAARDAAERLVRVYEQFQSIGGAAGAIRRYARIAVLASTYAGWAALEMPADPTRG